MKDRSADMLKTSIRKLLKIGAKKNIEKILTKTHIADIAALLEEFTSEERLQIFNLEPSLNKKAEIISYLNCEIQKEILLKMKQEDIHQIISLMDTDDAANLLRNLPEDFANNILSNMNQEDSEEMTDLLGYPTNSAGALMSADYLALNQDATVSEAITELQKKGAENLFTFYVYVVNKTNHLVGVLSLKQLLLSKPNEVLKKIMSHDVISVTIDRDQEDVAKMVEKYDFLSIPVVNNSNELMGVITVDDVIDVIRAESEEDLMAMGQVVSHKQSMIRDFFSRLPWLFFAFLIGIACYSLINYFINKNHLVFLKNIVTIGNNNDDNKALLLIIMSFVPMMLSLGGTSGNQSLSVALGYLRSDKHDFKTLLNHTFGELKIATLIIGFFCSLTYYTTIYLFALNFEQSISIAIALSLQILFSMLLGSKIPFLIYRFSFDTTLGSVSLLMAIINLLGISILFTIFQIMGM